MLLERTAAIGTVAEPEGSDRAPRQATVAQIGPRLGALRALQFCLEERRRHLHHILEAGALTVAPRCFGIGCRQRHAGHVGDALNRFRKIQAFEFGEKFEMVARHPTAKTMVAALAILAVKARGFFAMERTAGPPVAARGIGFLAIPGHVTADHVRDRNPFA